MLSFSEVWTFLRWKNTTSHGEAGTVLESGSDEKKPLRSSYMNNGVESGFHIIRASVSYFAGLSLRRTLRAAATLTPRGHQWPTSNCDEAVQAQCFGPFKRPYCTTTQRLSPEGFPQASNRKSVSTLDELHVQERLASRNIMRCCVSSPRKVSIIPHPQHHLRCKIS